jgi:hypothetical protein
VTHCHRTSDRSRLDLLGSVGIPAYGLRESPEGTAMPKMVVTHAVVEIERWLQGKAERAAAEERHGVIQPITVYIER